MNADTTDNIDKTFEKVYKQLQNKLKEDPSFRTEIDDIHYFYGRKLMSYVKDEKDEKLVARGLEDVIRSQFFQGYYIMKSILEDEESNFESDWTLSLGIARNELPKFLNEIFEDADEEINVDWTYTPIGHKFSMDVLQMMENGFDVTVQIRKDLAYYGAYKAFIEDERYVGPGQVPPSTMLLGDPFDLEFLSPQVYIQAEFSSTENEIWDLYMWSPVNNGMWSGSIHLTRISAEQTFYVLEIKISNLITDEEKESIIDRVIKKIPLEIQSLLQTRIYYVEDIKMMIPVDSKNNK